MAAHRTTIDDALRRAVADSGRLPVEIAREAGINPSVLSVWLRGKRGLTVRTADRIAAALGLSCALGPEGKK